MIFQKALSFLCVPFALAVIGSSGLAGESLGGVQTTGLPPPTTASSSSTGSIPTTSTSSTPTTSSTATTSTSGSSGSTTGSGVFTGPVYEQRLYEQQIVPTVYKRSGSSVTTLSNQHAVLVRFILPTVSVSAPYELVGVSWDVATFGDGVLVSRSEGVGTPSYEAAIPKAGTLSPPTEAGILYGGITAPGHVVAGLASFGALSGGKLRMTFRQIIQTRRWVSSAWVYETTTHGAYAEYDVAKLLCSDASIDTRRGHGQPNLAGEYPGDPNAPARPINFGGWTYKGGLFVGNMPAATGDQSGLARTQLYVPSGGAGTVRLATLSLYDLGSPSTAYGIEAGVYLPSSTDPNLSVGEGAATWENKWSSIEPRDTVGSPPDDARDPLQVVTISGTGDDYRNFPLHRDGALPSTMALSRICIALTEENFSLGPFWRYFGSKEYAAAHTTFPRNDSAPRVWRLGVESAVTW